MTRASREVEQILPRWGSPHAANNRVFCKRWGERLVRSTLSRLYVVGVLHLLRDRGEAWCRVPHSPTEQRGHNCSDVLAGGVHRVDELLENVLHAERQDDWRVEPMVPDHPWCSHVVAPIS